MEAKPFVIERTLNAPVEKVWQAITNKDQMKEWYFDLEEFKPEVGFEFQFEAGSDTQKYVHKCRVTVAEPNRKLAYTWSYENYEGNSEVTWELAPYGNATRLRLTHTGLETFKRDTKDFAPESFAQGWTHIVGKSLPEYLEQHSA